MKNLKNNKGFTLIELLVVVAIIGILSAVVLASLSTARTRGKDAAIKSALSSARAQAEIVSDGGSYDVSTICASGAFGTDPVLTNVKNNIMSNNGNTTPHCTTGNSGSSIQFDSQLTNTGTATYWCVDSNGYNASKASPGTNGTCN